MDQKTAISLVTGRPALDAYQLPFLVRDYGHMEKLATSEIGQKILDDLEAAGIVGLHTVDIGQRHFLSKNPVKTLPDFAGVKTRIVPVPLHKQIWEAVGAAPVGMPYGEVYGAMETGRIAWECRAHEGLHLNADRFVLELLPGSPTRTRTVITALDYRTMPILRYDLGDHTAPIEGDCRCGLSFPRIQPPRGRLSRLVRLPGGRAIASWSLRSILREMPGVDQYRLEQESPARLVAHLVLDDSAPDPAVEVERRLRPLVGPAVRIDVIRAASLPPGTQGTDLTWRA